MVTTFIIGLTFGLVGKYLVYNNTSGNFILPVIAGLVGAYAAHFIGNGTHTFTSDGPIGQFAPMLGSMLVLGILGLVVHREDLHRHS